MNMDLQISPAKLGQDIGLKRDRVGESMRPDINWLPFCIIKRI